MSLLVDDVEGLTNEQPTGAAGQDLASEILGVLLRQEYVNWEDDEVLEELEYLVIPLDVDSNDLRQWHQVKQQLRIISNEIQVDVARQG